MAPQSGHDAWVESLTADEVQGLMHDHGVTDIFFKVLSARQDNDKNQIYLGSDLSGAASRIPSRNLRGSITASRKPGAPGKTLYQADINFHWLTSDGPARAPNAKIIFYPQYPEVRLSGLRRGCEYAPQTYYVRSRGAQVPGRVLVFGVKGEKTFALLLPPMAPAAKTLGASEVPLDGVVRLLEVKGAEAMSREQLLGELHGVHQRGLVPGGRISRGRYVEYWARPAIGATLEAQLGVDTNALAEPDFAGWELKAYTVKSVDPVSGGAALTLFTNEPTGGLYRRDFKEFMRRYGYENPTRPGRLNFVGIQRVGAGFHERVGLRLELVGMDADAGDHDPDGYIVLRDRGGNDAATWSFVSILDHWRTKHARCAFVPALRDVDSRAFWFGPLVTLAEGASFLRLLSAIKTGDVYYDPGCWVTINEDGSLGESKRRNQWRVRRGAIPILYDQVDVEDARDVPVDNTHSQRELKRMGVELPKLRL